MYDLDELGNSRESWCAVELNKSQAWCRTERQHYQENFKSTVFDPKRNMVIEERCLWKVDAPVHREKRHFAISRQTKTKKDKKQDEQEIENMLNESDTELQKLNHAVYEPFPPLFCSSYPSGHMAFGFELL